MALPKFLPKLIATMFVRALAILAGVLLFLVVIPCLLSAKSDLAVGSGFILLIVSGAVLGIVFARKFGLIKQ